MIVYIDLIFMTNLLIDGTLLWLTGWMRKTTMQWWRILLSAVVGALYVMMMFVPQLSFMYTFLVKFGLSLIMLWVAFGFRSLQNYIRNIGTFYIINFAAAGGIIGIHYLLQSSSELWSGVWFTTSGGLSFELKIGFWFIFIVFFVVMIGFKMVQSSRNKLVNRHTYLGEVTVHIGDQSVNCRGLLDTGNQLSDPLTRMPVMIMEVTLWEEYLPASWKGKLAEGEADKLVIGLSEDNNFVWQDRLRLVPYRGVNRGTAFMLALKPDSVEVVMDGKVTITSRVLVGLDSGILSTEGAYRAIIHPDLVEDDSTPLDVHLATTTHVPPI